MSRESFLKIRLSTLGVLKHSWEPPSSLVSCERLLDSFWKHVETSDVAIGTRIYPDMTWIGQFSSLRQKIDVNLVYFMIDDEIKYFAQTYKVELFLPMVLLIRLMADISEKPLG